MNLIHKKQLHIPFPAMHRNIGKVLVKGYIFSTKYGKMSYILDVDGKEVITLVTDNLVYVLKSSPYKVAL